MSGLPQNEESQKLQLKCQEMSEAIQQCIDKLKSNGAHVSSDQVVTSTSNNDITSNSDPQIAELEPSEVCNLWNALDWILLYYTALDLGIPGLPKC